MINYLKMVEDLKRASSPVPRTERFDKLIELFSQFDNYRTSKEVLEFYIAENLKGMEFVSLRPKRESGNVVSPLWQANDSGTIYGFYERKDTGNCNLCNLNYFSFSNFDDLVKYFVKRVAER